MTLQDFLSIFTSNDSSDGRKIKVTTATGDGTDILTTTDNNGGRKIKVDLTGSNIIQSVGTGISLVVLPDGIKSLIAGANISIVDNGNDVTITGANGQPITIVANYAALPSAATHTGEFYWCSASQGTAWLPGWLGGTYYPNGLYYCDGVTWEPQNTAYQATQATVDAGIVADQFVSPNTFQNSAQLLAKVDSVSGTANRITSTGGTTPAIDISATFEALLGKVANPLSQFAATTSDQLRGVISDETGSGGGLVFATGPTLSNPIVGTQAALDNSTKAASTAYVDALVVSPKIKSGVVAFGSFAGNPKKATVTFVTPFANANYSVSLIGINARTWSVESYVAGSFVINANSNPALTGNVYWTATKHGEN